jgi:uncharacterized membrane-anchored protein
MNALQRVPEITVLFWIIKLLTTGMGETTSDYLAHQMNPIFAVALAGSGLTVALLIQFAARRYIPWVYWLAVMMVAIFGTMAADAIHVGLGIPYLISTAGFAAVLGVIFAVWYGSERTLSIHRISTVRREYILLGNGHDDVRAGHSCRGHDGINAGLGLLYVRSAVCCAVCPPRDRILALRTQ